MCSKIGNNTCAGEWGGIVTPLLKGDVRIPPPAGNVKAPLAREKILTPLDLRV